MAQSRGRSQLRQFLQRRRKGWEEGPGQTATQTAITTNTPLLLASGAQVLEDGLTVLRIRGQLDVWLSAASAAINGFGGAFGIGITNLNAFGTGGVASVMTPDADKDWDGWLFWHVIDCRIITATFSDNPNTPRLQQRIMVDSKAMRKLKEDDVIYAAIDVTETGTAILESKFDSRLLVALP